MFISTEPEGARLDWSMIQREPERDRASQRDYEQLNTTLFCRETLKYGTFCRETLKYAL